MQLTRYRKIVFYLLFSDLFQGKKCLYFSKVLFNFFFGYFSDILMTSSIFEDICDGIRNICDGIRNICEGIGFSHTFYVYRHANLCSGLRAILSPQLIKKEFAILSILPRMWHHSDSNPQSSRTMSIIQIGHSTDYAMGQ